MAGLLVAAVTAVAFGAQPPSLAVAEFAPAARQGIDAPPTTTDPQHAAAGGRGRGRRASTTSTTAQSGPTASGPDGDGTAAPVSRATRSRACVGNPPRQIEDPQSPPCVATIFEGDNGGATTPGVTSTEIRVSVPIGSDSDKPAYQALFDFFNQRFELYGRRLVPAFITSTANGDPQSARALAADIAATNVFAAVPAYLDWGSSLRPSFFGELARHNVVSLTYGQGGAYSDAAVFDQFHPFVWSVYPSLEEIERNFADFACTALAGKVARHAGDANLRQKTRSFGVVVVGMYTMPSTRELTDRLAGCDAPVRVAAYDGPTAPADAVRNAVQSLKDAGVTTVTCICTNQGYLSTIASTAQQVGFAPEWILSVDQHPLEEYEGQSLAAEVRQHMLLFTERPRVLPVQQRPWFQAINLLNPQLLATDMITTMSRSIRMYPMLLLLASGIQGAGPALTPDTFATALQSMTFPNPGVGQAPYWQPSVGFAPGDHAFVSDFALASWSETLPAYDTFIGRPQGSWCYLDGGTRYRAGSFPSDADSRFFGPDSSCH